MQAQDKIARTHTEDTAHGHDDRAAGHGDGVHGKGRFARHYLEMVVAMFVGMVALGAATRAVLALAGAEFSATRHPELTSLEMAFDMSVGMVVWMRHRGHGRASNLEMCGAMFAPALALFPLLWLDVIAAGSMLMLEHAAMFPLMLLVMLRRRSEHGL
jgi:flagellar biosynthetic protein FliP